MGLAEVAMAGVDIDMVDMGMAEVDMVGIGDPGDVVLKRSPVYVLRLVLGLLLTVIGFFGAYAANDMIAGLAIDTDQALESLPQWVRIVPSAILGGAILLLPLVVTIVGWRSRGVKVFGLICLGTVAAAVLDLQIAKLFDSAALSGTYLDYIASDGSAFLRSQDLTQWDFLRPDPLIAAFFATVVIGSAWARRSWVGQALALVILGALSSLALGVPPITLMFDLGIGLTVGSAIALAFGTPNLAPNAGALITAMNRNGLHLAELRPAKVDARGSRPWFGSEVDGTGVFLKALHDDERSADLMFRAIRAIRFRGIGDTRPNASLRQFVEHEALVSLKAASAGIRTPDLLAVSELEDGAMALAYRMIDGKSLDSQPEEAFTDEVLDRIWSEVLTMRSVGIAHRDLRLANVFLDESAQPWIIDFGFAELAASDRLLASDIAELLSSTCVVVGPERAVAAAHRVLGADALVAALPRIQPVALGTATRVAISREKLVEPLRTEVVRVTGAENVELEPIERVNKKTVFTIVTIALVAWFLIPQIGDLGEIGRKVTNARPAFFALALVFSLLTYAAAGVALAGSVAERIQIRWTIFAQMASSFANRVTPSKVGGLALNIRFLQKQGVETPLAAAGVGINAAAGVACHVSLLAGTLLLVERGPEQTISVPSVSVLLMIAAGCAALTGVLMLLPVTRRILVGKVLPNLKTVARGIKELAASPIRLVQLFGGSYLLTLCYVACLWASLRAFDGSATFGQITLVSLTASIAASVAPTPGGLGAAEAAFMAGLVAIGVPKETALPTVFLYRLASFWLPILPGWLAMRAMQRNDRL